MSYSYEKLKEAERLLRPLGFTLVRHEDVIEHYAVIPIRGEYLCGEKTEGDTLPVNLFIILIWSNEEAGKSVAKFFLTDKQNIWLCRSDVENFISLLNLYIDTIDALNSLKVTAIKNN